MTLKIAATAFAAGIAISLSLAACNVPSTTQPTPTSSPVVQPVTPQATTQPIISTIEHNGVTTTTEWDATSTSTCIYIQHDSGTEFCTSIDAKSGAAHNYTVKY